MLYNICRFYCLIVSRFRFKHIVVINILIRLIFCIGYYYSGTAWEILPLYSPYYEYAGTDGNIQLAHTLLHCGKFAFDCESPAVYHRPPLPPLFMAIFGAYSTEYWFVILWIAQILLVNIGLYLFCLATKNKQWSRWQRNSLLLTLTFQPFLFAAVRSTTFLTLSFVLAGGIIYSLSLSKKKSVTALALTCGCAALTHGSYFVLVFLGLIYSGKYFLRFGLIVLLFLSPWWFRNLQAGQNLFPLYTGAGLQYWIKEAEYIQQPHLEQTIYQTITHKPLPIRYYGTVVPADDRLLWQAAWEHILTNPTHFICRTLYNAFLFWFPTHRGIWFFMVSLVLNGSVLVLWGISSLKTKQARDYFVNIGIISIWGVFSIFAGQNTYFTMLLPLVIWQIFTGLPIRSMPLKRAGLPDRH